MKINLKRISENAVVPMKGTEHAGGWDVVATDIIQEAEDVFVCKLGWAMQPEDFNYKITIVPRSSFTKTHWILQNSPTLNDPDYTGELMLRFKGIPTNIDTLVNIQNTQVLTYDDFPYLIGDRVGQMYLEKIIPIEFEEVNSLVETKRGSGGFGSTGK